MIAFFNKLYKGTKADFFKEVAKRLEADKKQFIVTANPEAFVIGERDNYLKELMLNENTTVVADGIGIIKGADMLDINVPERIPGVELAEFLLDIGNKSEKSIYLLGAKPEVLAKLCEMLKEKYPSLKIAGATDGYTENKDLVFEEIKRLSPDIILVALGIPHQEKLIYKHLNNFNKGIFVGVGGSFDVLSGAKQRAPEFFIKHNLEWLYRILKEPKRIKRFYNSNVKFLFKVRKLKG